MIVDSATAFRAAVARLQPRLGRLATARAALLVSPRGFRLAEESEQDNRYMTPGTETVEARALAEHAELVRRLRTTVRVALFAGDPETPDAVFPNNVFATADVAPAQPKRLIIGRMRHAVRRREAEREDVRDQFLRTLGYQLVDLSRRDDLVAELTGPLVIDHARAIGYCGLTGRCDRAGAEAMHAAFGLALTFVFELDAAEYHTNVVLSILAGRAAIVHAGSFVDPAVPRAIASVYGEQVIWLSDAEKLAFAGNCIALGDDEVWMSRRAEAALTADHRRALERWGFRIQSVELDEIEKAGGSLRCCVAEIF